MGKTSGIWARRSPRYVEEQGGTLTPVSRTVGESQLVDEMIFSFTHTQEMPWMEGHRSIVRRASCWRIVENISLVERRSKEWPTSSARFAPFSPFRECKKGQSPAAAAMLDRLGFRRDSGEAAASL